MDYLTFDTLVIGSGAAGYNAACEIKKHCDKSVCIITEGINCGTSRNTGSDKQTYYKLTLSGSSQDSVRKMAEDLFSGGSADGDNALCEAALSARCFFNLCDLGVPFPTNRYGEYVGYKTDHDPYCRATSAGPLTSHYMTVALENKAKKLGIPVFDKMYAAEIIKTDGAVSGLLCFDKSSSEYRLFRCNNIVLATGGPAGIYENTVYPDSHTGSSALILKAGASLQNMTEWQYGLASVDPKWNVSGTYMQVLPRFISVDKNGNEHEFLKEYSDDIYYILSLVFLKGYQWPFDSEKAENGSSLIDIAVYNESMIKGRKVYLDFTKNPFSLDKIDWERLCNEAYTYLRNADALFGTPAERLQLMNSPAIELFRSKGIDITEQYLEIALCAQHNNGGAAVDMWWQTGIPGLFAAGECAGTHGVARPGGSALNAGQAGSLRAAQFISRKEEKFASPEKFLASAEEIISYHKNLLRNSLSKQSNVTELLNYSRKKMSTCAAAVRNPDEIKAFLKEQKSRLDSFPEGIYCKTAEDMILVYRYLDTLLVQIAVLLSVCDYWENTKSPRGSAVYISDSKSDSDYKEKDKIREISYTDGNFSVTCRNVRPIPENDDFFENVWRQYRENKNIY